MAGTPQSESPRKPPVANTFSTGFIPVEQKRRDVRFANAKKMARLAPVETFMAKFVQYHGFVPEDDYFAGLFDGVLTEGIEDAMYAPFVSPEPWSPPTYPNHLLCIF